VTLDFLSPISEAEATASTPPASSPLEHLLRAAGARFEVRDGWRVPTSFGDLPGEVAACREGAAAADRSALGKLELQARPGTLAGVLERVTGEEPPPAGGSAPLEDGFLWRSSPDRALAVCEPAARPGLKSQLEETCSDVATLVDLTAGLAGIELRGARARELLERLSALDLRPGNLAPGEVLAGVVARVPAALAHTEPDAFLVLVPSPQAQDAWELVLDVGAALGLRVVGEEARSQVGRGARARA
jgi:heterotetrameric sarcosine oxidase gamma subunit